MWSPSEIFFIVWYCSFAPDENARLSLSQALESKEKILIEKIVKQKEDIIINNSISLRNDN